MPEFNYTPATEPAATQRDEHWRQIYVQLRAAARQQLNNERPGHTLSATAPVHEAFLRLRGIRDPIAENPAGFYAGAVSAMRRILIDHARARNAAKRGGGRRGHLNTLALDAVAVATGDDPELLEMVDEAITALEAEDPRKAQLVRLRFFAGLTLEQAGEALNLPPATADRHWAYARAWLYERLSCATDRDCKKS